MSGELTTERRVTVAMAERGDDYESCLDLPTRGSEGKMEEEARFCRWGKRRRKR